MFLQIGLAIALLIAIGIFSWSQSEITVEKLDLKKTVGEMEIIEVTRPPEQKPEAPKTIQAVSDIINVVKNDVKIDNNANLFTSEFMENVGIEINTKPKEEAVVEDQIFLKVEKMPTFEGKDPAAFRTWVQQRVVYPSMAQELGIQGKVVVGFVVEPDGSLSNIQILASPDKVLSDEVIRVVKSSPKWTPGEQRGKKVRVNIVITVTFNLQ